MEYFKRKDKPDDNIDNYLTAFQFKEYKVNIKGSSMLENNKYFGDYDLYSYLGNHKHYHTTITEEHTIDELYEEFMKIIHNVSNIKHSYFVEFKMGNPDGDFEVVENIKKLTKTKFKKMLKAFKPLDFVQIEYINFINDRFITMTSDYFFKNPPKHNKILEDLTTAIKSLIEKENYYKVLKRVFNIYQSKHENKHKYSKDNLKYIVEFFNSSVGRMSVVEANLKAIIKVKKAYPRNKEVKKLSQQNLKNIGYKSTSTIQQLEKDVESLNKEINKEAKELFVNVIV